MREQEASEDDLDIEIIDLDAPSSRDAAARPTQQAPVHVPRKSRHSKRQQLIATFATTLAP